MRSRTALSSVRRLLCALCALGAVIALDASPRALAAPPDLAPQKGWRVRLPAERIEGDADPTGVGLIPGLSSDEGTPWPSTPADGAVALTLDLPEAKQGPLLFVVEVLGEKGENEPVPVALAGRAGGAGSRLEEVARGLAVRPGKDRRPAARTLELILPGGRFQAARLTLGAEGGPAPRLKRLRLYRLDRQGRNDSWLFVGASISVAAIDPDLFAKELCAGRPDYDPLVVNEAVSGSTAKDTLEDLPEILARHPHARYVAIDVGGNDISNARPFPGGSEKLRQRLEAILEGVRAAGKVPILERLTYRAYKKDGKKGAVPPEENGSGPYVTSIYDPLIARWCPAFFDRKAGRGAIDLYGWFQDHREELGDDGVHPNDKGGASFRRIWAEEAGAVVYGPPEAAKGK